MWNDAAKERAVRAINAQLPVLLAKWSPIIGRKATHVTLRIMTSRWGVMHAENRPHPTQPATWSYGSQIPGIRACARNDAPVGKRARRGLSAAYERIFAAMEAIAAGAEPSCCVVMLAMLLRSPSRCHAAMSCVGRCCCVACDVEILAISRHCRHIARIAMTSHGLRTFDNDV